MSSSESIVKLQTGQIATRLIATAQNFCCCPIDSGVPFLLSEVGQPQLPTFSPYPFYPVHPHWEHTIYHGRHWAFCTAAAAASVPPPMMLQQPPPSKAPPSQRPPSQPPASSRRDAVKGPAVAAPGILSP
ncbi:unnamed protein product [Cuscuta campestris]|uniref:Uncharacterized protein n=1 Tax=Cuscuta campestris TaxID=132261 RepID=A0A484MQD4_9ASTE|nr:unnamed protein product [Cuscuta campestris]